MNCVHIPITVVFDRNKPIEWYFYSKKESELKRKRKFDIDAIIERFSRLKKKGTVVAEFLHKQMDVTNSKTLITIELLTQEELGRSLLLKFDS